MNQKIELLAPAGGMLQLTAAIENGADAVYLGGHLFNARMNAQNFTENELQTAIEYAHLRNVKVYITLNVLLEDEELLPALHYAAQLYYLGADALILQDLGFASLCRQHIPKMPIHLSTQGTVYNKSGIAMARELGFSRVVLAREMSIEEIKVITEETNCETEVFIHGALCMCYSGQCQMSRMLGGRSGNRGACAQPCRLAYTDEKEQSSYALSPKDLCGIDRLGQLMDAGVTSLKIEGRMKSPEYVAIVVGIYRKYMDQYLEQGNYTVEEEDRMALEQIYSRGAFTEGYFNENPGMGLLSGKLPKHQGIYIGTVQSVFKKGQLIDVLLEGNLAMGDGIEIQSQTLTGNIVTYLKQVDKNIWRLGDIRGTVMQGDRVYRISQLSLMKTARQSYENGRLEGKKFRKKVGLDFILKMTIGENPQLTIAEGNLKTVVRLEDVIVEAARNKPLTEERLTTQLSKLGGTPFYAKSVTIAAPENAVIPMSAINGLRREAIAQFSKTKQVKREIIPLPREIPMRSEENRCKTVAFYFYRGEKAEQYPYSKILKSVDADCAVAYIPLQDFMEGVKTPKSIRTIPYLPNITKGALDKYLADNMDCIIDKIKNTGILVGNIGWIKTFIQEGITVYGDYGFNITNRMTAQVLNDLGIIPKSGSLEKETCYIGPVPLMVTEHLIPAKQLEDRKKATYQIVYNFEKDKCMLLKGANKNSLNLKEKLQVNCFGEFRINVL